MFEKNNTHITPSRAQSGGVQSVIFCVGLSIFNLLPDGAAADGPINIIDGKTIGRQLPLGDIGLGETTEIIGTIALGTLANTSGGGKKIHIPMQDIEDAAMAFCSSSVYNFIACYDMMIKK